ncbi:substrate-binding domain-containing protein [Rhodobacteraceae bacterium]|nr:substrate-binding domain-containing protein [Paracoccaceae bacterium]
MRATIHDVAREADVSLSTVDRVLNGRAGVRKATVTRVNDAIARLGYQRNVEAANLAKKRLYRFVVLIPDGPNAFMQSLRDGLAALGPLLAPDRIELQALAIPAFDAAALATRLDGIAPGTVDGVAMVATEGRAVSEAVARLQAQNVPVVTLVSDLPGSARARFIGIDNVAAGRTAAGLLGRFCEKTPQKLAVIAGSMLVRDHVERRLGFEQVIRTEYPHLEILPTLEGRDDAAVVHQGLQALLAAHPDIGGIYSLGAGNRGLIRALDGARHTPRPAIVVHELTPHTREALISGLFDAAINQDPARELRAVVAVLRALVDRAPIDPIIERIGVEVFLRDNLA